MSRRRSLRIEIQALRAAAVLSVVFYHLWPDHLPGGFVGVDVFFAVSGFLITGHLLAEVDRTGRMAVDGPAAESAGIETVDLHRWSRDAETCPVVVGGVVVYRDAHHMTATYSETIAPFLVDAVRRDGR